MPSKNTLIFFALVLSGFMAGLDFLVLSVAIDPLIKTFSISITMVQWVLTAFAIGDASFLLSAGRLADIFDRKKVFMIGVFIFIFSSFVISISQSIWLVIGMRFLQGIGSGLMITTAIAIINSYCSEEQRAGWVSGVVAATGLGMVLGPLLGGFVVETFSWRMIFLINVPFGLVCLGLSHFFLPSLNPANKEHIDFSGIILFALSISLLTVGLSKAQSWSFAQPITLLPILLSAIFFVWFIFAEKHTKQPMLHFHYFKNMLFNVAITYGFLCYFIFSAWMIIFGFYLQTVLGISPAHTGLYFAPFGLALFAVSPAVKFLSARYSTHALIRIGFFISLIAFLGMIFVLKTNSLIALSVFFALFGVGFTFISSCCVPLSLQGIRHQEVGIVSGLGMMLRWLGAAVGAALITSIYTHFSLVYASLGEKLSHLTSVQHCLWIFVAIAFLSIFMGIGLKQREI